MLKLIILILSAWLVWVGYQYFTKSQTAYKLVQQKINELNSIDTNLLLQKAGKEFESKEVEIEGKKYFISWIIQKSNSSLNSYNDGAELIEVRGRVDFIDLLPFGNYKVGSPFKLIINIKEEE
ncbi:MAG: hypothetical protein NTW64_03460 [Candidatus Omnitrophica bacterium]|nr:hypothetical protein [Candidatus Omnitrophota bacterium]